jgi:hypothetical protein
MHPVRNPFDSSGSSSSSSTPTDDANATKEQVSFACFYIPKMILVFLIWTFMFITYTTATAFKTADPSFQVKHNIYMFVKSNPKSPYICFNLECYVKCTVVALFLLSRIYKITKYISLCMNSLS